MHEEERRKIQERRASSIVLKPNTILASAFEFFIIPTSVPLDTSQVLSTLTPNTTWD